MVQPKPPVPGRQGPQTRSDVLVGGAISRWPIVQSLIGRQTRSVVLVPGRERYSLAAHDLYGLHSIDLEGSQTLSKNVLGSTHPSEQFLHTVFSTSVHSARTNSFSPHRWQPLQDVSLVAVQLAMRKCVSRHSEQTLHSTSEVRVAATEANWPSAQLDTGMHTRSDDEVGAWVS